jgi:hypothetical protein
MSLASSSVHGSQSGQFTVDLISNLDGTPADVIDTDLGFEISGTVVLPAGISGEGHVAVYADELGGPRLRRLPYQGKLTAF